MKAGILVTGTEVVSGRVDDENGPWLASQVEELGLTTVQTLICRDDKQQILESLSFLKDREVDLLFISGGLGPTADDLTAEAVSDFCSSSLVLDEALRDRILDRVNRYAKYVKLDREALERASAKQACVPEGAEVLEPVGTAPGFCIGSGKCRILVLPGPPGELRQMWPRALQLPSVKDLLSSIQRPSERTLRLFGIPESEIAETQRRLEGRLDLSGLEITTCAHQMEVEVVIRYGQGGEEAVKEFEKEVEARHDEYLFSRDGSKIEEQVASILKGRTLAVAESCTAGLLAARITEVPGSSNYFSGGVITYSNEAKVDLLGVDGELIARHGAVSAEVAEAMASGAVSRFKADVGVAVTGVAGPEGGTPEKPVGRVFIAVVEGGEKAVLRELDLPGNRRDVRGRATTVALHLLRRTLVARERHG